MLLAASYQQAVMSNKFSFDGHQTDARDEQKEKISLPSIKTTIHNSNLMHPKNWDSQIPLQTPVGGFTPSTQRIKIQSLLNDDNSSDFNCDYLIVKPSPTPTVFPVDEKQTLNAARILASIHPTNTNEVPSMVTTEPENKSTRTSPQPTPRSTYELSPSLYSSLPECESSSSQSDSDQSSNGSKPKRAKSNLMLQMCSELWMKHYTQLKEYHKLYGNTNVTRTKPEWKTLGNWVAEQRRKLKNGKLSREQLKLLNALGFEWDRQQFAKGSSKRSPPTDESQAVQFVVLDRK